ncbi:MAG: site-specific integrase [Campylobacterales bacterium]|nr:site-specific integrase [Campylobacterales bacterium]
MQDIKASILSRGNRKFWYVKYQVLFENDDVKTGEESTKVLKTEKTLKYMQTQYLSAWISRKREELKVIKFESKKFSYYFEKFLELHKEDKSYHNRVYIYQKVNNFFKEMDVKKITRLLVKDYLAELELKNTSKKDYLNCIKGVLDIALDGEIIHKNVAIDIRFKRTQKEPIVPFSAQEVELFIRNTDGMFKNYLGIAFNTGLRSGEILGLMHGDILEDRITIKRSISKGRITTPKTLGSIRDIPMFEAVKPFIESQKKLSQSLYLFDYDKAFIKDATFFKRRWHQLVKDCDVEYRKLYNSRHTFITAMLNSEKFKIMEIAAIVGHTSPQMIMTNYAGFIKNNHLKVDTSIDLFANHGDTLGDTNQVNKLKRA